MPTPAWEKTDPYTFEATAGPFHLEVQEYADDTWSFWIHLGSAIVRRRHGLQTAEGAMEECLAALGALCRETLGDVVRLGAGAASARPATRPTAEREPESLPRP